MPQLRQLASRVWPSAASPACGSTASSDHSARQRITNCLEIAHHPRPLRGAHYAGFGAHASCSRWRASVFSAARSIPRIAATGASASMRCALSGWTRSGGWSRRGNPLEEDAKDMASFEARLASARRMARGARIRASEFEQRAGTRYTIDTVRRVKREYPQHRFIWLLGSDTLANFHKWRDWRGLPRKCESGDSPAKNDSAARAARAMGWLRRFVHPSSQAINWTDWSAPAILFLRLPPDPTSATAIRALYPQWHRQTRPLARAQRRGLPLASRRALDRTSR